MENIDEINFNILVSFSVIVANNVTKDRVLVQNKSDESPFPQRAAIRYINGDCLDEKNNTFCTEKSELIKAISNIKQLVMHKRDCRYKKNLFLKTTEQKPERIENLRRRLPIIGLSYSCK